MASNVIPFRAPVAKREFSIANDNDTPPPAPTWREKPVDQWTIDDIDAAWANTRRLFGEA